MSPFPSVSCLPKVVCSNLVVFFWRLFFFSRYWWTCTLSSPGKKLVTHLYRLKYRKLPNKCHKIKYRNVRRFWSLHATSSTYIQCEKKPGDVWNNLCAMVPKTRKRLPRASFSRYPSEALWPNIRLRNSPDSEIVECSLRS